jgi:hypothetical protein
MRSSEERQDAMATGFRGPLAAALIALVLPVAGCGAGSDLHPNSLKARYGWTEEKMLAYGWLDGRFIPAPPIYCYRTLGTPECFDGAQPREASRLIGYFENPPEY